MKLVHSPTSPPAHSPQMWTCTRCGAVGRWTKGWKWWGAYTPNGRENVNAVHCPDCPTPKDGPNDAGGSIR